MMQCIKLNSKSSSTIIDIDQIEAIHYHKFTRKTIIFTHRNKYSIRLNKGEYERLEGNLADLK